MNAKILLLQLFLLLVTNTWSVDMGEQSDCTACVAGVVEGTDVPHLFHHPRKGGTGGLLYNMLHGASYASLRGWIYGGPVEIVQADLDAVNFVFNAGDYFSRAAEELKIMVSKHRIQKSSELSIVVGPPWTSSNIVVESDDWPVLEKQCPTEDYARFRYSEKVPVLDQLMSSTFLNVVKASNKVSLSKYKLDFVTSGRMSPRVAIHLRRGNGAKGSFSSRKYSPDTYFFSIIEIIRDRFPDAEVHAYPSLGLSDGATMTDGPDYDGYRKRNVTLHFQNDMLASWANMISADIFVMSHSVYSSVPALLSQNCVVYDPFWFGKLSRYLTMHSMKEKMSSCYQSDAPTSRRKKGTAGKGGSPPMFVTRDPR